MGCLVVFLGIEVYASWGRYMLFAAPIVITASVLYLRGRDYQSATRVGQTGQAQVNAVSGWMKAALVVYFVIALLNQFPLFDWSGLHF